MSKGQQCSRLEKHFYLSISCLTVLYIAFFYARLKINFCLWWRLKLFAQANAGLCTDWFAFWRLLSNQRSGILNKPKSLVFPGDTKIDLYTSPLHNTMSKPVYLTALWLTGPLQTLMHFAPRTQIPRISCYTKLPMVVKTFSTDLVSVRTTQSVRMEKIVIRSNGSGYLLEQNSYSFQRFNYPFKKIVGRAAVPKKNVILNNSSKCCLPSPHEFPRRIFCWIAFFTFMTFDSPYKFYSRL